MTQENADRVARHRMRKALVDEIDPEELAALAGEVSLEAWKGTKIMKANTHKGYVNHSPDPDPNVPWSFLNTKQQRQAMNEWILAISATKAMRIAYCKAALLDPMTHMKIMVSLMPKEVELQVSGNVGIVVVPAKMGVSQDWVAMATGTKPLDGEVLGCEEALTAAEVWRRAAELDKGEPDGGDI